MKTITLIAAGLLSVAGLSAPAYAYPETSAEALEICSHYHPLADCKKSDEAYLSLLKAEKDAAADAKKKALPGPRMGQTAKHVLEKTSMPAPSRINTTVTRHGTTEQWVYGDSVFLYFTNGRLTGAQY